MVGRPINPSREDFLQNVSHAPHGPPSEDLVADVIDLMQLMSSKRVWQLSYGRTAKASAPSIG